MVNAECCLSSCNKLNHFREEERLMSLEAKHKEIREIEVRCKESRGITPYNMIYMAFNRHTWRLFGTTFTLQWVSNGSDDII